MPVLRHTLSAIAAAVALLSFAAPAFATPGVTSQSADVYAQAGGNGSIGSIGGGTSINVEGCSGDWCKITDGNISGWIAKGAISFKGIIPPPRIGNDVGSQSPQPSGGNNNNSGSGFDFNFDFGNNNPGPFPQPDDNYDPRPPRPQHQQAQACFYSGTNFRGDSFCVMSGDSFEYLPEEWDNEIRSVEVTGRARVDLCRDENYEGACATIRSSQSRLPSQIDRRVSSLEVY